MKLFKISKFVVLLVLMKCICAKPDNEEEPETDTQIESNEDLNAEPNESVPKEETTKENEWDESNGKQPPNELNEVSNGNENAESGNIDDNRENEIREPQEATKASDSSESLKDKVKDTIDGVKNYIKNILKCQLSMPGFRQCIMSESAIGFSKSEASDNPFPTAPPEVGTGFTGYNLGEWIKFVSSKAVETPSLSFAHVSVPNANDD